MAGFARQQGPLEQRACHLQGCGGTHSASRQHLLARGGARRGRRIALAQLPLAELPPFVGVGPLVDPALPALAAGDRPGVRYIQALAVSNQLDPPAGSQLALPTRERATSTPSDNLESDRPSPAGCLLVGERENVRAGRPEVPLCGRELCKQPTALLRARATAPVY